MNRAKNDREEGAAARSQDPETGASSGLTGKLADMTQSVPLIGGLGDLSLTYALRWLLWLAAVLLSLTGLGLVIVGSAGGVLALGSVSAAAGPVLTDAGAGVETAAMSLEDAGSMTANFSQVSLGTAGALSNLSQGLTQTATNLDSLSSLSKVPGMGALDFSASSTSLRAASSGLGDAIASAQAGGTAGEQAAAHVREIAGSLHAISADLNNARAQVEAAVLWMQIGVLGLGAGTGALLSGVLLLALSYGPPKKN
ncbi:Uncharacterised protein [uncultured archaeon]|nr:Uncharacterised protein [uncultured archaeon]